MKQFVRNRRQRLWGLAAIPLLLLALLLATLFGLWTGSPDQEAVDQHRQEQIVDNRERFKNRDYVTELECVDQEVSNPLFRNNEQNIRICQLERQVAELQNRLDEITKE